VVHGGEVNQGGRIVSPDQHHDTVKKLCAQLTSRRQKAHSSGCLRMESKAEMAARGFIVLMWRTRL
jgi:hypothetical protein